MIEFEFFFSGLSPLKILVEPLKSIDNDQSCLIEVNNCFHSSFFQVNNLLNTTLIFELRCIGWMGTKQSVIEVKGMYSHLYLR